MINAFRLLTRVLRIGGLVVPFFFQSACDPRQRGDVATQQEILQAMEHYQVAARLVDADSIAACFTENGTLFEPGIQPIVSRHSIRAFVRAFAGAKVHLATATADTVELFGETALVWGSYHEQLSFPGQPDSDQRGRFVAEWRKTGARWLIHRLYRIPLP